ncbi:MAG: hypothetical protein WCI88_13680 [Chloroflexota bacterium]
MKIIMRVIDRRIGKLLIWLALSVFVITQGVVYAHDGSVRTDQKAEDIIKLSFSTEMSSMITPDPMFATTDEMDGMEASESTSTPTQGMSGMGASEPISTPTDVMSGMGASEPTSTPTQGMSGMGTSEATSTPTDVMSGMGASEPLPSVAHTDETASAELEAEQNPFMPYGILIGFFGLNIIILGAAAITRRKTWSI